MGFQQRKKDYLQRLIEDFFAKFQQLLNEGKAPSHAETEALLVEGFEFFSTNFEINKNSSISEILSRLADFDLSEQYAKLLVIEYELMEEDGKKESLQKALEIIEYLQNTDTTFSWERTILREDILRLLEQ